MHDLTTEQDSKGGRLLLADFWKVHDLTTEQGVKFGCVWMMRAI